MTDESNRASGGDGIARELEIDVYGCNDERCGRSRAGREAGRRNAQFAGWSIRYGGGCREIAVAVRAHGGEYGSICRERDRFVIAEAAPREALSIYNPYAFVAVNAAACVLIPE